MGLDRDQGGGPVIRKGDVRQDLAAPRRAPAHHTPLPEHELAAVRNHPGPAFLRAKRGQFPIEVVERKEDQPRKALVDKIRQHVSEDLRLRNGQGPVVHTQDRVGPVIEGIPGRLAHGNQGA